MQKGFASIVILIGLLIAGGIAGGVYLKFISPETFDQRLAKQNPVIWPSKSPEQNNKPSPGTNPINAENPGGQSCGQNAGPAGNYSCPKDYYCKYTTEYKNIGTCAKVTGWNAYISENEDYRFQYPSEWVFYTSKGSACSFQGFFGTSSDKDLSKDGNVSENFSISICFMKGYNNPKEFPYSVSAVNGEVIQGDNPTVQFSKLNGYDLVKGQRENPSGMVKNFAFISDNKERFLLIEVHPGDVNILEQIISTIKFN